MQGRGILGEGGADVAKGKDCDENGSENRTNEFRETQRGKLPGGPPGVGSMVELEMDRCAVTRIELILMITPLD